MKLKITDSKIKNEDLGLKIKISLNYNDQLKKMRMTVEQVELDKVKTKKILEIYHDIVSLFVVCHRQHSLSLYQSCTSSQNEGYCFQEDKYFEKYVFSKCQWEFWFWYGRHWEILPQSWIKEQNSEL